MLSSNLSQNVGHLLTQAREEQKLSIDEVVSILKVRRQIIHTIENDGYENQQIDVYFKGHIVAYCRLLNLNHKSILNNLEAKGYDLHQQEPPKASSKTRSSTKPKMMGLMVFVGIMLTLYHYLPSPVERQQTSVIKPFVQHSNEIPYV